MQPKFTLKNLGFVSLKVFALALIFTLTAQSSYAQENEQKPSREITKDAFINPPPARQNNQNLQRRVSTVTPVVQNNSGNIAERVLAPSVIATPPPPQYPGNNSRGATNSQISFCIQNTNGFDMKLTDLGIYFDAGVIGGPVTGSAIALQYSSTSLSGTITNGAAWQNVATGTMGTVGAPGVYPALSGMSFVIPAGVTYRFSLQSSLGLTYSGTGTGAGTPSPNSFSADGVNLQVGDFKISGQNVGYAGDFPAGTLFNARYFMGSITVDRATCTPTNATAPTISPIPTSTCAGTPTTLSVIGGDLNGASAWKWYTGSCGGTLVGTGNSITVNPAVTTTYYVRGEGGCAPAPGLCGTKTLTIISCTCITPSSSTICVGDIQKLSVNGGLATFSNSTTIRVPGVGTSGIASPYPSAIAVSGLPVTGVTVASVQINGLAHSWPSDIDMVLVAPDGTPVVLMSDVGGATTISGVNLIIKDGSPALTGAAITSGTYRPSNIGATDNYTAPGPGSVTQASPALSSFLSTTNHNGSWNLFVVDDIGGDFGSISGGWSITFSTGITATWSPATNVFTNAAATTPYVTGANAVEVWVKPTATTTYTATVNAGPCAGANLVTVTVSPLPTVSISPNPGGCAPVTLTASGTDFYNWSPGAGLSTTSGATVIATPTTNTIYTVTGTSATTGCSNTASVPVNGISIAAVMSAPPAFITLINEGFNAAALPASWSQQNLSSPIGAGTFSTWYSGVAGGSFPPQSGADFRGCAFLSGSGTATLSNWLFSPQVTVQNGDVLTFWAIAQNAGFPDRLQVRWSANGASTNAGATATSVGDFSSLLLDINPTYTGTGFPGSWTKFTVNITGLAGPSSGRLAFRYFVENGGPAGSNSDNIGLDNVQLVRPLSGVCPNTVSTISVAITGGIAPHTLVYSNGTSNFTYNNYNSGDPIQVTPGVTTNYTIVSLTGANGCAGINNSGIATIAVVQPPAITSNPSSATTCVGANATFTVGATPAVTTTTYQWQLSTNGGTTFTDITNGGVYSGATTSTLTITAATAVMNGYRYRAVVSGQCPPQPVTSGSALLTVNVPPVISSNPASISRCLGTTATFTVAATVSSGNPAFAYQWQVSVDGGVTYSNVASGGTSATLSLSSITQSMSGNRYRAIVSVTPCTATVTSTEATLTVIPLPTVTISAPDLALTPPQTTVITGASSPAAAANGWAWTLNGAGISGTTNTQNVNIDNIGSYQATVTDVNGCVNKSNILVIGSEASDRLWIYPNPTNGAFQVRLYYDSDVTERRRVTIYNAIGQAITSKHFTLADNSAPYLRMDFDLTNMQAGTYVVKVAQEFTGKVVSGLVIVQ